MQNKKNNINPKTGKNWFESCFVKVGNSHVKDFTGEILFKDVV